jgi:hypothetical protein
VSTIDRNQWQRYDEFETALQDMDPAEYGTAGKYAYAIAEELGRPLSIQESNRAVWQWEQVNKA